MKVRWALICLLWFDISINNVPILRWKNDRNWLESNHDGNHKGYKKSTILYEKIVFKEHLKWSKNVCHNKNVSKPKTKLLKSLKLLSHLIRPDVCNFVYLWMFTNHKPSFNHKSPLLKSHEVNKVLFCLILS